MNMYMRIIIISILVVSASLGNILAQNFADQSPDSTWLSGESQKVDLAFRQVSELNTTGVVTVINIPEILRYDNAGDVYEILQGRIPGMMGGINLRGAGNSLVVVDGIPRSISSVNIQEIEQITVLRGVSASVLYGVQAQNGVILITTKRGKINEPRTSIWAETGFGSPVRLPNYLNSADYMELYNEARDNDGIPREYSDERIAATRNGENPTRYPDTDYYSSEFLNSSKPYKRAVAEFSGGNDNTHYYVNAGWLNSGTLLKMGDESRNRLNLRSNIDFRVNDFIKSNIDVVAIFDQNTGPNGNFWLDASQLRPNLYSPLIDTALVSSNELLKAAHLVKGRYILGGTTLYRNNVYGNLLFGGYGNRNDATAQFSNGIDVDLAMLTKGLSMKTYVSFDYNKNFIEGQNNEYAIYGITWSNDEDRITGLSKIGSDRFTGTQSLSNSSIFRKMSFYGSVNYSRLFADKHNVSGLVLAYADKSIVTSILQDDKNTHLAANLNYIYDDKYILDINSAMVSSARLAKGNRVGLSPALALGWIISREDFLQNNSAINFLKLNISAGIINSDKGIPDYYLYQNNNIAGNQLNWGDGTRSNYGAVVRNVGNNNLFYEKREEVNLGVEAVLFNHFALDVNLFTERITDKIVQRVNHYPTHLGGFIPFENFEEDKYTGIELGAKYGRNFSKFGFNLGVDFAYIRSEASVRDEYWENNYQYRAGKPVSAMFALQADGLFKDAADISAHATQTSFGQVKPGDIKYVDYNKDGVIDQSDIVMVGKTVPDFVGGFNFRIRYNNFSLFGLATALTGYHRYASNEYYWVYGDRKYSEIVRNRWTSETAETATYPRLTSQFSSNNFRSSTFWMYDNSRVSLNRLQFNYEMPNIFGPGLGIDQISLYLRGSNLVTIAENRDKMELSVGSEPQYRSYSLGLKVIF
jgi:TonB-linked SusC/RagA family outer membrane protein